ncbi:MAG: glutathione S-transferase [Pseudomonadota bacterium]
MRAWLLKDVWELPIATTYVDFSGQDVADQLAAIAPARTVPTLVTPDGAIISESLALSEELATRFPDAGLWPADPKARAIARGLASEMHAGFGALREACPMNLRVAYQGVEVSSAVRADLARIDAIWSYAQAETGSETWLCGDYSIADAFYAPIAARIATYDLPVSDASRAYVQAHLNHQSFRQWRAMGFAAGEDLPWYRRDYDRTDWPGPQPIPAKAVAEGDPVNELCPYSGDPITHLADIDGTVIGYCNAFCRDKTVADPGAWPKTLALLP